MEQFEDFYVAWYSRARRMASGYVGMDAAEDIVQDVFVRLYERRDELDSLGNPAAYLFTAVKRKCLDVLRREVAEQRENSALQETRSLELRMSIDSLEALDVRLPDEETVEQVLERALSRLPERCRTIFVMNKLKGIRQKQIASQLDISVNTVETQMAVAYRKLRDELRGCMPLLAFIMSQI